MDIAANHHEYIDGSGYPRGLKDEQLDLLTRLITVCDIFDSLTADDRPYKKKMTLDQALEVLAEMVDEGKLDAGIVRIVSDYMKKNFDKLISEMKEEEIREKEIEEIAFGNIQSDGARMEEQEKASGVRAGEPAALIYGQDAGMKPNERPLNGMN